MDGGPRYPGPPGAWVLGTWVPGSPGCLGGWVPGCLGAWVAGGQGGRAAGRLCGGVPRFGGLWQPVAACGNGLDAYSNILLDLETRARLGSFSLESWDPKGYYESMI